MVKHAHEIALEAKQKKIKKEQIGNQCLFTQVDEINHCIMDLNDRIDNFPTSNDIREWNEKLDDNFKRLNQMLLELKGVVCAARSAVAERKECDNVKKPNKEMCENLTSNDTLKVLASENCFLRNILKETQEKLNQKKWWQIWR